MLSLAIMYDAAVALFAPAPLEVLVFFGERYCLHNLSDMAQDELPGDLLGSILIYSHPQAGAFRAA
jgi:hypothetical protein